MLSSAQYRGDNSELNMEGVRDRFARYTDGESEALTSGRADTAYHFTESEVDALSATLQKQVKTLTGSAAVAIPKEKMTEVTRDEFNAKLETIEVRMDSRVASIESKIDAFLTRVDDRFASTNERFDRMETGFKEVRQESKNIKWWLAGTAIATVIGLYAANVSMVQTMLAAFESGKSMSSSQAEIKRQSEETGALLRQLQVEHPPAAKPK